MQTMKQELGMSLRMLMSVIGLMLRGHSGIRCMTRLAKGRTHDTHRCHLHVCLSCQCMETENPIYS